VADAAAARRIRLVIADDHPIFLKGLRALLESEPGFEIVGEARNGAEAVQLAQTLKPDVLLLDVAMPGVTGLVALEKLAAAAVNVRTILLTAAIEKSAVVTALQLGARGVVLKESATQVLFRCIHAVMRGQYWVGSEGVAGLIEALREMMAGGEDQARKKQFGLTKRENEIVAAIVSGLANRDIAKKFTISEDTVKHHLTNIFDKTGVSSRLELALFAVHHKLVHHT
jgi:DNA-binding NarL/FixJ family response regulator